MELLNVNIADSKKEEIENAVEKILSCEDGIFVTEVYAKDGSFKNGLFGNWVSLMVEVEPEFQNTDMYNVMDDIMEYPRPYELVISIEPDMVERGHGTILWKRGKII